MAGTMQLEFSQAMTDFKIMFPEMDREVIEAVLRANQGAVDATIDQLLAMSTDNQLEIFRKNLNESEKPKTPATAHLIDTTDGDSSTTTNSTVPAISSTNLLNLSTGSGIGMSSPNHQLHNTGASPKQRPPIVINKTPPSLVGGTLTGTPTPKRSHGSGRWNPPMVGPLPPGFLRIAPLHDPATVHRDYELPDEQFAMMIQNSEFMNQLRWNQEFMNALEIEQSDKAKTEDDAAFKERLKHMGKVSRKKFLQMARVFTWQRNKKTTTAKQIDSLPLKEEPSDDEDHHHRRQ